MDAKFQDIIEIYRVKHLPKLEHSTQQTNSYLIDHLSMVEEHLSDSTQSEKHSIRFGHFPEPIHPGGQRCDRF